jgi:hypothetical protein
MMLLIHRLKLKNLPMIAQLITLEPSVVSRVGWRGQGGGVGIIAVLYCIRSKGPALTTPLPSVVIPQIYRNAHKGEIMELTLSNDWLKMRGWNRHSQMISKK